MPRGYLELSFIQAFNTCIHCCSQVTLLFEVEDLAVASPATVSRSGMVYNDWKDLGWEPYVRSWLSKRKDKVATIPTLTLSVLFLLPVLELG